MNLRVLGSRVLIEHEGPLEDWDTGGLIARPEQQQIEKASRVGRIVAFGPKCTLDASLGARVVYQGSWTGAPIEHEGKLYRVLEQEDCALVVAPGVRVEHLEM